MVASLDKKWTASPYSNALGTDTPLGMGFLREIEITLTGVIVYAFVAADFGFNSILNVISLVGNTATNTGYYITNSTAAGFTLNAPQDSVVKVFVIGTGI